MLRTKYITADDFLEYTGIDLKSKLKDTDNPSDKVNAFLHRVEVRMEAFLNANFFKRIGDEWPCMSDYQKLHYKYALLEQALYVFRNGDISIDSGYEPDEGIKLDPTARKKLILSPNAQDQLQLCGLWTRKVSRTLFWGPGMGWWF